ncbi:MAG TPA: response regulator [Ktedonobacteraceae bacterium]|nr:response regulator [Ktedonobacteraceae bacterium]
MKKRVRLLPLPPRSEDGDYRILLIDDSPTIREVYKTFLQKALGVRVTAVGGDLIAELRQLLSNEERYDLVFVDIILPRMNGLKVIKRLRKELRFHHVPIIAISRRDGRWDRLIARLAGAQEYVIKPIPLQQLMALTRKYLDLDQDAWLR